MPTASPGPRGYTRYSSSRVTARTIPNPFTSEVGGHFENDGLHLDVAANKVKIWWAKPKFTNAWICTSFNFPKDHDNKLSMGLVFWNSGHGDFAVVHVLADGRLSMDRYADGKWASLGAVNVSNILGASGNSLEVVLTSNRVQVFLNDRRVSTFEHAPPPNPWQSGIFAQSLGGQGFDAVFPSVEILELK
jgi:hypothetical protein